MRILTISLLFCSLALLSLSCKSKRGGQSSDTILKKRSAKYVFKQMDRYHLDAEWFSAKANVRLEQGKQKVRGNASIRMRKDSIIWMAVKKLGVEGGRMLVTKDSVFIINRLDKTFVAQPFDYIRNLTGLAATGNNLSDFRNLYQLILGNVVLLQQGKYKSNTASPHYILSHTTDNIQSEYWANGNNFTLHKMLLMQRDSSQQATCTFKDYKTSDERVFSHDREWDIQSSRGNLLLEMDFSKVVWDKPMRTPFSIPRKYKEAAGF